MCFIYESNNMTNRTSITSLHRRIENGTSFNNNNLETGRFIQIQEST